MSALRTFIKRIVRPDLMGDHIEIVERDLLTRHTLPAGRVPAIFMLASPRTGSTALYQMMAKYFGLSYFSNFVVRHFPAFPLTGAVVEAAFRGDGAEALSVRNAYGESFERFGPSEASEVFDQWYPRLHPAETRSHEPFEGAASKLTAVFNGLAAYHGAPVLTKNAWNCFRVESLSTMLPDAKFIWLRRDIVRSSYSTLLARCKQGDPARVWNSASPAGYEDIRMRPAHEQVVEQQYWTNQAVEAALGRMSSSRHLEVWYEDLVKAPRETLTRLAAFCGIACDPAPLHEDLTAPAPVERPEDMERIRAYSASRYPSHIRLD